MSMTFILLILVALVPFSLTEDFQSICQAGIRQDNTKYDHRSLSPYH